MVPPPVPSRPAHPARRKPKSWRFLPWIGFAAALPAGAAVRSAEQWLPPDTLAYVSVPSADAARIDLERQPPFTVWSDPAVRGFREHFEQRLESSLLAPLARVTGFHLGHLLALAEGQVTLAVLPPPKGAPTNAPLDQLLLLDAGARLSELTQQIVAARTLLGAATNAPAAPAVVDSRWRDLPVATFTFAGDRLDAVMEGAFPSAETRQSKTPPKPSPPIRIHAALVGSALVAATEPHRLAEALDRLTGVTPVAASPFAAETARFDNSVIHGWLNGPGLLHQILQSPPPMLAGLARAGIALDRAVEALGLRQLRAASFAVKADAEGWANELRLNVPAAGRKGLFAFLQVLPADAAPPTWVGADVVSFRRLRLPGPASWEALEQLLREIDPSFLGVLQLFTGYAGKTEDADFDFDKGLIARLGNDWMAVSARPATNRPPGEFLVHGSTNAAEIHAALKLVAAPSYLATFLPPDAPAPTRQERILPGGRLVSVLVTNAPWSDSGFEQLYFGARSNLVVLSHGPALPTAFLSGPTLEPARQPLAALPALGVALRRSGGTAGGWFEYGSERDEVEDVLLSMSRADQPLQRFLHWAAVSETTTRFAAGIASWLDFSLLPAPPVVARHFHLRVASGHANAEGFTLTTFRPRLPNPVPAAAPAPAPAPAPVAPAPTAAPSSPPAAAAPSAVATPPATASTSAPKPLAPPLPTVPPAARPTPTTNAAKAGG